MLEAWCQISRDCFPLYSTLYHVTQANKALPQHFITQTRQGPGTGKLERSFLEYCLVRDWQFLHVDEVCEQAHGELLQSNLVWRATLFIQIHLYIAPSAIAPSWQFRVFYIMGSHCTTRHWMTDTAQHHVPCHGPLQPDTRVTMHGAELAHISQVCRNLLQPLNK